MADEKELEYLRKKLSEETSFYNDHQTKSVNVVLLVLGAAVVFVVDSFKRIVECKAVLNFIDLGEYSVLCLIFIVIAFIVVVVLLFAVYAVEKGNEIATRTLEIKMYILLFYENKIKKGVDHIAWETTVLEMDMAKTEKNYLSRWIRTPVAMFAGISFCVLCFFVVYLVYIYCVFSFSMSCVLLLCCFGLFLFSFAIMCRLYFCVPSSHFVENKKREILIELIKYYREKEYFDEEEIVARFGNKFLSDLGYYDKPKERRTA